MNKFKETYDRPTTDLVLIRFELGFLNGSILNSINSNNSVEYIDTSDDGYETL